MEMLVKMTSFQSPIITCSVGDVAEGDRQTVPCSRSGRGENMLTKLSMDMRLLSSEPNLLLPILTLLKLPLRLSITAPAEQFSNFFLVISRHHNCKWTLGMYAAGVNTPDAQPTASTHKNKSAAWLLKDRASFEVFFLANLMAQYGTN